MVESKDSASEGDSAEEKPATTLADERPDDDELGRLKAENEALKAKVEASEKSANVGARRARNGGAAAIAVIATLVISLAVPAVWLNRMVTNTDYYVQTVAPLARDAAIQDAVAAAASDAIVQQLDATNRIRSLLPTNLAFVAAPIGQAANDFVHKQATTFVRSDAFPKVWDQINTTGHKALVAAVTGKQDGAVTVQSGTITLDVGILAQQLAAQLSKAGLGFVNNLPVGNIHKQITLYHSDTLAQAGVYVNALSQVALALPIIGLVLAIIVFALAADRRKAALWFGWSLLVWTVLPLQAIFLGQTYVAARLQTLAGIPTPAAQNAYNIIFAWIVSFEQLLVGLSVIIVVAAMLAGPSRWATAVRGWLTGGIGSASSHLELGVFGEWVAARMQTLRTVGYVLAAALLIVLPRPRTMTQIWWIVGFVVVWLLVVQVLGSGSKPMAPSPDVADDGTAPEGDA